MILAEPAVEVPVLSHTSGYSRRVPAEPHFLES
ncbi:hypothetical protein EDD27_3246 [Nonomuraea polychroma]|uniref:Uncharacterized protein n=1 Tax=Nonomuraea polychroma TaxID=46176 RepID=A0A438M4P6_9ACTN|nr:hypothetical protein EDD27_3246 [Nonomuraea polychroma]